MIRLAAILAVVVLGAAWSGNASAATTDVSSNWSGYAVSSTDPATPLAFSSVSGVWRQPAVDCSTTSNAYAAFWVGLGGWSETSQALEQIGTEADCGQNGVASYSAWYELVPAASVPIKLTVKANDYLSAKVTVTGQTVVVSIRNITRKTTFTKTLTMAAPDVSSAEWIAEAPSSCASDGSQCRTLPLANFGTVAFSSSRATANGHTGTISDPMWSATAVTLSSSSFGGGFPGRYRPMTTTSSALPSALNATGGAFTVAWSDQPVATDPTQPTQS